MSMNKITESQSKNIKVIQILRLSDLLKKCINIVYYKKIKKSIK